MGRSEQCSKQSATVVLASLSRTAREVFRLIADAQLDPSGEQGRWPLARIQCAAFHAVPLPWRTIFVNPCSLPSHLVPLPPAPPPPPAAGGVTFQRLFQQCRDRFLVSNEMTLRTFLTEFGDHDLLQTK